MRDVLDELVGWWQAGETVGMGTVVATWRSAPRPAGASMLVGPDGKVASRPVKVGSAQGGEWVILEGLQARANVGRDGDKGAAFLDLAARRGAGGLAVP